MKLWDENYKSTNGFSMGINHARPFLTSTSRVNMNIRRAHGFTHIDLQVQSVCLDPPQPLTDSQHETVKWLLPYIRNEAGRATKKGESEDVQSGIMYVIQALQVRLNQHWHAVLANKEVSLDELLGLLTVEDDGQAEENVRALMESLTVEDKKDEAEAEAKEGNEVMKAIENTTAAENDELMKS